MANPTEKQTLYIEDGQGRLTRKWLRNGKPGNLATMREMRQLVRDHIGLDGKWLDEGLREWAVNICQQFGAHDWDSRVNALFLYTQKLIYYIPDPAGGNDDVADPRTVIRLGFDDCDGLATLLATLLSLVGVTCAFKAARYSASAKGYQHVYPIAFRPNNAGTVALDPTYANSYPGWEARAIESVTLPILGEDDHAELDRAKLGDISAATAARIVNAGVGAAGSAAAGNIKGSLVAGASLAVSFIPVVGPFLAPVVGLIAGLFHHGPTAQQRQLGSNFDVEDKNVAAFLLTLNTKATAGTLTGSDLAEAASQVTQLAQLAQSSMQSDASGYVKKQWAAEQPRYASWLQALAAKVVPGSEGTAEAAQPGANLNSVANVAGIAPGFANTIASVLSVTKPTGETDWPKIAIFAVVGYGAWKVFSS